MTQRDNIIETYLGADDETRLHIYLQHPPLRNEFIKIDLSEKPVLATAKKTRKKYSDGSFRNRWRTAMGSCCLRFRGP